MPCREAKREQFTAAITSCISTLCRPDGAAANNLAVEMAGLDRSSGAFVLASRGEGWGRPYMEAMASGLPTIGTQGSGNDDFMHDGNSFLVSTTLVDVPDEAAAEIPFYRGHQWLEPNPDELRRLLRLVAADEPKRKAVGKRAVADMKGQWPLARAREAVEANLTLAEERLAIAAPCDVSPAHIRVELEGELFAGHSLAV